VFLHTAAFFSHYVQTTFSECTGYAQDAPGCSGCEPILFADMLILNPKAHFPFGFFTNCYQMEAIF